MSYLHSRGVVHADLKTKNIFFENESKVVITDFGHFRLAAELRLDETRYITIHLWPLVTIGVHNYPLWPPVTIGIHNQP
jgi:serine/threonine protein kinase